MEEALRILIVDDHAIVREGLRLVLKRNRDFSVVGEAANGKEALERVEELRPQVVLMDLSMPIMDGVTAIGLIKERFPEVEVVALTSVLEDESVVGAVKAGATGYVLKDSHSEKLMAAIAAAANGQVHLAPAAAARLVREIHLPESSPDRDDLTAREWEVLENLALGLTNKEISNRLVVGEETIKTHVSRILQKLNTKTRTQAALVAWQRGWIERQA